MNRKKFVIISIIVILILDLIGICAFWGYIKYTANNRSSEAIPFPEGYTTISGRVVYIDQLRYDRQFENDRDADELQHAGLGASSYFQRITIEDSDGIHYMYCNGATMFLTGGRNLCVGDQIIIGYYPSGSRAQKMIVDKDGQVSLSSDQYDRDTTVRAYDHIYMVEGIEGDKIFNIRNTPVIGLIPRDIKSDALITAFVSIPSILFCVILYSAMKERREGRISRSRAIAYVFFVGIVCLAISIGLSSRMTAGIIHPRPAAKKVNVHAPVIYLYSDTEESVNIRLDINGELTASYPYYDEEDGWDLNVSPDGTLTGPCGVEYDYLFWEADLDMVPDTEYGFCVPGSDTEAFLEDALYELGLTDREAAAFIEYWLPQMEDNAYNVISFQVDAYNEAAILDVTPEPDVTVRVNMLWYPTDEYVKMPPQFLDGINIPAEERKGLVLVEWGGEMTDMP